MPDEQIVALAPEPQPPEPPQQHPAEQDAEEENVSKKRHNSCNYPGFFKQFIILTLLAAVLIYMIISALLIFQMVSRPQSAVVYHDAIRYFRRSKETFQVKCYKTFERTVKKLDRINMQPVKW